MGRRSKRLGTRSTRTGSRRRAADDGRRADVRFDRRYGRRRVEHDGAGTEEAAAGRRPVRALASGSPRAPCCTMGQGNGIPENRCRAGRWGATGETMAAHLGRIPSSWPTTAAITMRHNEARAFIDTLAERLDVNARHVQPGVRGHLVLPVERTAVADQRRSARIAAGNAEDREAAGQNLRAGLGSGRRLRACPAADRKRAGDELAKRPLVSAPEHMYLIPGDSPMGYRLPLDSLPWVPSRILRICTVIRWSRRAAADFRRRAAANGNGHCPMARRRSSDLLVPHCRRGRATASGHQPTKPRPVGRTRSRMPPRPAAASQSANGWCARPCASSHGRADCTSSCPPRVSKITGLVAAVEETAAELGLPVMIEGYHPPNDHRLRISRSRPIPA